MMKVNTTFTFNHSKKYWESRENRDAMLIIVSGLEIFLSQNTKGSKNYLKL